MACDAAPAISNSRSCDGLFRLASTMDLVHSWTGTMRLRQIESVCVGSANEPGYWQLRATAENLLGNHRAALEYYGRTVRGPSVGQELPADTASTPALEYIATQALDHRVVMVNERHHVATERLLTLALLRPLYEQGFRYLAAEALWEGEDQLNRRGYPIRETGGYVSDVVFGELLREAIALGYTVVPYEASQEEMRPTDTMSDQQARDYWQAQRLIASTLKQDPQAKVLVHCGYSHLVEVERPGWTPMAHYFREATGIDPLTVDQTIFTYRSINEAEHPWRIEAEVRALVNHEPVILMDGKDNVLPVERVGIDVTVLNPRTEYRFGRPAWMTMGGRRDRVEVSTPECAEEACVVEAFNTAWEERAVPYDRVETNSARTDMYLPPDIEVEFRGYRRDGSLVFRRTTVTLGR